MTGEERTTVTTDKTDPSAPQADSLPDDSADQQDGMMDQAGDSDDSMVTSDEADSMPATDPSARENLSDDSADRQDELLDQADNGDDTTFTSDETDSTTPATDPSASVDPFDPVDTRAYETRWGEIQTSFVDDPRGAVEQAGTLLTDLMGELSSALTSNLEDLDRHDSGDTSSTEELRGAFRRYRSVFDRLVAI
jgi:hypothetical protein